MTDVEKAHLATADELRVFWQDGDLDLIHDPVWVDEEEPVRTATACNKVTSHGVCSCTEFVEGGRKIGRDTEPSCGRCLDTRASHQPRKTGRRVRR